MIFVSTRNAEEKSNFRDAIFKGLAPDGGLYYPTETPNMKDIFASFDKNTPFNDIATKVIHTLLHDEMTEDIARKIVDRAFDFGPKLVKADDNNHILELYHGPSCAFKDFGASFLAASMEEFLEEEDKHAIILTATSGDTGSAVAQAFYEKDNIDVVILYPSGRVSPLQEKQLTTLGKNIHALEVKGAFDDCQRMVKEAFVDKDLTSKLTLSSANSINLGRLIPQSLYYIWAYSQLKDSVKGDIHFCVPSGNFGNLTAGMYAWTWGLPVKGYLAATNANDVVPEYLEKGIFSPRPSVHTLSNAMDVGDPSNFERLTSIFNGDIEKMRSMITGKKITDAETKEMMQSIYKEQNMLLDPHTAVGLLAARQYHAEKLSADDEIITLSTAHPGKFIEVVEDATGQHVDLPGPLQALLKKEKQSTLINNNLGELSEFLLKTFG